MTQEDQAPDDVGAQPVDAAEKPKKDALSSLDLEVKLTDLKHLGVQKLVLDRLNKAESRIRVLEETAVGFNDLRVKHAKEEARVDHLLEADLLQSVMLAFGSLIVGFLPALWGNELYASLAVILGGALVLGSVSSKRRSRK
ncbi:hypothetical protein [Pseudoxanthomonas sp. PXM02]|uniref:hypothetical protein n=1 Tax=Pseudoxanthomonas sp. PXM02 TaxID=2769294 RepID=UPI00177AB603|nr:hypothetical protein [Pseudoxanthomonas sp. PXM02]MBD9479853.1 hypothetical protein [Pseudoxanthomonas sp. PXM02]